jgi:ribosomal protein S18 acetylase RimI-like enzyme
VASREPSLPGRYLAAIDALRGEHYVALFEVERTATLSALGPELRVPSARCWSVQQRTRRVAVGPGREGRLTSILGRGGGQLCGLLDADRLPIWPLGAGLRATRRGAGEVGSAHWPFARGPYDALASKPLRIRRAVRADLPAMLRIEQRRSPTPGRWTRCPRRSRSSAMRVFVAESPMREGRRGCRSGCWAMLWRSCVDVEAEIADLAVAPTARRSGSAGAARAVLAELSDAAVQAVYLEVRESNQAARTLYRDERVLLRRAPARVLSITGRGRARAQAGFVRPEVKCHVR